MALDEALLLKREAEEAVQSTYKQKRALEEGDKAVVSAAETTVAVPVPSTSSSSSTGENKLSDHVFLGTNCFSIYRFETADKHTRLRVNLLINI